MNNQLFGEIKEYVLKNGLKVIVNPDHKVPKVSVQLWYNVGSKDELSGQKGLAHLLEHMIFKGTHTLSESDINLITQKLSGYTNAFTSYDYTSYVYDFPKQHWTIALELLADCMTNCTFKEDLLQSELKAVIQELKMYKDNYSSSLIETMMSSIFADHPYHYPIIGYKQDLWSITQDGLMNFYRQHYIPNNATLVVVGDVQADHALQEAERYFSNLKLHDQYKKSPYYTNQDVQSTRVTLYRDVHRPLLLFGWRVPGLGAKKEYYLQILAHIIGQGTGSRLYSLLVDRLHLATDVNMFTNDLFEHDVLFLHIEPIDQQAVHEIKKQIKKEIVDLHKNGFTQQELERAIQQVHMEHMIMGEKFQERAYVIGKSYLATNDASYINSFIQHDDAAIKKEILELIHAYIRPNIMHEGNILPLDEQEKKQWLMLQQESDKTDEYILSRKVRSSIIESGKHVHTISKKKPYSFDIPQHQTVTLSNGLPVLFYPDTQDKIELALEFTHQSEADPDHLQGLCNFVFQVMQEGTQHYSKSAFIQQLESRGMQLDIHPGLIELTLFKRDLELGLSLLYELVELALLQVDAIKKVRKQIVSDIDDFWDEPHRFVHQLACEHIYKGHPYSKHHLGTHESIERITQEDILRYYAYITPVNARLAIVGGFDEDTLQAIAEKTIGQWSGTKPHSVDYPTVHLPEQREIIYPIHRDQIVLAFAGLSVDRKNALYDPLLIFDQLFTGGNITMSSRLFQLREQTGLFYTIGGSVVFHATDQPGMFFVKTVVSKDRLTEAEQAIKEVIKNGTDSMSDQEIHIAKDVLLHMLINQFATQKQIVENFLLLDKLNLPIDYFTKHMSSIESVDKKQVIDAAKQITELDNISVIKIGRL